MRDIDEVAPTYRPKSGRRQHSRLDRKHRILAIPIGNAVIIPKLRAKRGREITDYLYRLGSGGQLGNQSEPLANSLASMARMYQAHSAWEDTVIFPAWKKTQSKARLDELAEKFEEIEHQQFGKDGFDDAVQRIARIEQSLGLADLGSYTADHPPTL